MWIKTAPFLMVESVTTLLLAQAALGCRNGVQLVEQVFQPASLPVLVNGAMFCCFSPAQTATAVLPKTAHAAQQHITHTSDSKLHMIVSRFVQALILVGLQHVALEATYPTPTERLISILGIHNLAS